jgi:hypothetical protein
MRDETGKNSEPTKVVRKRHRQQRLPARGMEVSKNALTQTIIQDGKRTDGADEHAYPGN